MALPAYLYRNPMEVLEQKQENELNRSCAGCVHVYRVEIGGSVENGCNKGKVYGRRCKFYQEESILFKNVDSALRWAAQISMTGIIDSPSLHRLIKDQDRAPFKNDLLVNLTPQEIHAQAAQVIQIAEKLRDPALIEYIYVRYCYLDKLDHLITRVESTMGGVNRRAMQELVFEYCGRRSHSVRDLKRLLQCGSDGIHGRRSQVYTVMDHVHYQAMDQIEQNMIDAGLID